MRTSKFVYQAPWGLQKYKLKKYIFRVFGDPPSCPTNAQFRQLNVLRRLSVIAGGYITRKWVPRANVSCLANVLLCVCEGNQIPIYIVWAVVKFLFLRVVVFCWAMSWAAFSFCCLWDRIHCTHYFVDQQFFSLFIQIDTLWVVWIVILFDGEKLSRMDFATSQ